MDLILEDTVQELNRIEGIENLEKSMRNDFEKLNDALSSVENYQKALDQMQLHLHQSTLTNFPVNLPSPCILQATPPSIAELSSPSLDARQNNRILDNSALENSNPFENAVRNVVLPTSSRTPKNMDLQYLSSTALCQIENPMPTHSLKHEDVFI